MAWNGTVTCGHCYEQGHNKRGCKKLKEEIAQRRVSDGDDDWKVRHYDYHRSVTSRKGEKRNCTYCSEQGHNRRTCVTLKGHVAKLQTKSREWRSALLSYFRASGLGVGSMLKHEGFRGDKTLVVTGILWENAHYAKRNQQFLQVRNLARLTDGEFVTPLPAAEEVVDWRTHTDTRILSAKGLLTPPTGWESEGMSPKEAKEVLKEIESWQFDKYYPDHES